MSPANNEYRSDSATEAQSTFGSDITASAASVPEKPLPVISVAPSQPLKQKNSTNLERLARPM